MSGMYAEPSHRDSDSATQRFACSSLIGSPAPESDRFFTRLYPRDVNPAAWIGSRQHDARCMLRHFPSSSRPGGVENPLRLGFPCGRNEFYMTDCVQSPRRDWLHPVLRALEDPERDEDQLIRRSRVLHGNNGGVQEVPARHPCATRRARHTSRESPSTPMPNVSPGHLRNIGAVPVIAGCPVRQARCAATRPAGSGLGSRSSGTRGPALPTTRTRKTSSSSLTANFRSPTRAPT